ncbi:MAG: DNA translocase FtsK [Gammaproteobacteria bacterium]
MFSPHRRILFREILLVFGWLAVALLLVTLLTYSPEDPAWSAARGDDAEREIQNRFGAAGARLADILLSTLGYSSYLLCLIVFVALHAVLRPAARDGAERLGGWWCALGLLLFMLSSSALENIRFAEYAGALPSGAGGGVGELVAGGMRGLFGYTGAAMILLCIWIVSWSLASNLSWFSFCEMVGGRIEAAVAALSARLERRRNLRRGKKAGRARAAAVENVRRVGAHILTPPAASPSSAAAKAKSRPPRAAKPAPPPDSSAAPAVAAAATVAASLPSTSLLDVYEESAAGASEEALARNSELIERTLQNFGITVSVLSTHPGPVITRYDIQPDAGVKGAQIVSLVRDIARALAVSGIRVLETIPGKNCMGLEIPNRDRATVYFSDLIADDSYARGGHALPLALGKDATGAPLAADLAKMPHLLVAGATGSGKSVCVNAMLLSLLFASPPEKLRLILIDPKMLELASYHDIPHLLAPVVTDVSLAPAALNWAVEEMESRYRLMSAAGARSIDSYNKKIAAAESAPDAARPLPYIVIVIDELADLMMTTGKKVEMTISRLAQKARAAGIHLILATQRPSVDVITGLIKANVPCRIAFQVASKVDSRTIIDQMGAETLLGMGDMLYLPAGTGTPLRVHGAFVADDEVRRVADHLRAQGGGEYEMDFSRPPSPSAAEANGGDAEEDGMYGEAVEAVLSSSRPSISLVQRKLRIGYNRAARLIEAMEHAGVVSPPDDAGVRKILTPRPHEE